jgi:hypothetical protein
MYIKERVYLIKQSSALFKHGFAFAMPNVSSNDSIDESKNVQTLHYL